MGYHDALPKSTSPARFYFGRVSLEELLLIYLLCTRVLYFYPQGLLPLFWIVILNNKRWTQKTYTQIKTPSGDGWFYFSAVDPQFSYNRAMDHCREEIIVPPSTPYKLQDLILAFRYKKHYLHYSKTPESAEEIAAIMKVVADATAHLVELSIILNLFAKIMWKCIAICIRHQLKNGSKAKLTERRPLTPFRCCYLLMCPDQYWNG